MIPEEAAKLANQYNFNTPEQHREIMDFISVESPRRLRDFIHLLNRDGQNRYFHTAKTTLELQIAEEANNAAIKLSEQTDRLVDETLKLTRFTRRVYWLTVALGFFAVVQIIIMFFQYFSEAHKSLDTGVKEQAVQANQTGK
ncbi:MAG TPA: hypothetical protein VMF08_21250 [Candidatus Sulfotelmatobacter sp.]|nr:hypothetical protein [Candidatus Sulfotelmatobacter sp.]